MNISSILKQKKITQELEDKIKKNIEATSTYLRTVNQGDENKDAIEIYEQTTQQTKPEDKKRITFKYPTKTVQEADIDHHRKIHEQELAYKHELQQWNERNRDQRLPPPGEEDQRRNEQQPPTYIKPTSNVIKTGDTYMELKLERQLNRDTMTYEWVRQDTEILERPENGDITMEDNSISYENKEKTKIDWEQTLQNLKDNGEKLGYSKKHYLKCLLRIMNQNEEDLYLTYKEETCPEKIANSLLSRYVGMNKKKLFENKLKGLTRKRGQPIREVMCQADVLADRILYKCKDAQEKAYRKHQIMMDALKSFSSEENARELVQALRGTSLSGERPDIQDLIDTVEMAERINENSKPDRDKTFMNEKTAENCEIFTVEPNNYSSDYRQSDSLERAIQKTKEMSIRGREERRNPMEQNKQHGLFKNRDRSYDRNNQSTERRHQNEGQQRTNGPRERLQRTPDRFPSKDRYPSRERYNNGERYPSRNRNHSRERYTRDNSQNRSYNRERNYSDERKGRNYAERNRSNERNRSQYDHNRRRERSRDTPRQAWRSQNQDKEEQRQYQKGSRESYTSRTEGNRNSSGSRNTYDQRNREDRNYRNNSNSRPMENQRFRDSSRSRENPRYREYSRGRDSSNNYRGGQRENQRNFRSQSRDRNTWKTVPQHKRNLEGVEFPPKTLMDLTVKFCVKCHNTLEEHYPWDCKLYRYWSNSPCDVCYNGQHKSKECRKNPNRIDAFTMMLENTQHQKPDQMKTTYTPF